jgi:hypothetical protein
VGAALCGACVIGGLVGATGLFTGGLLGGGTVGAPFPGGAACCGATANGATGGGGSSPGPGNAPLPSGGSRVPSVPNSIRFVVSPTGSSARLVVRTGLSLVNALALIRARTCASLRSSGWRMLSGSSCNADSTPPSLAANLAKCATRSKATWTPPNWNFIAHGILPSNTFIGNYLNPKGVILPHRSQRKAAH